jgi:hypothetical protein
VPALRRRAVEGDLEGSFCCLSIKASSETASGSEAGPRVTVPALSVRLATFWHHSRSVIFQPLSFFLP